MASTGPRIYTLSPALAGEPPPWRAQLARLERMGFDWVHLGPRVAPLEVLSLVAFIDEAERHGLGVMLDLAAEGGGDVGALAELGVRGFRCVGATRRPAAWWREVIEAGRRRRPGAMFFGVTLGVGVDEIRGLAGAGFDVLTNSARWWDFRADWLLDQYEALRRLAPSVAFPEYDDGDRLAAEVGSQDLVRLAAQLKMRYLFAACFSSGVMMPIGFEYGFTRPLAGAGASPPETPRLDLTDFIGEVNALKRATPALNAEGPQRRVSAPGAPIVALARASDGHAPTATLLVLNPDEARVHDIDPGSLITGAGITGAGITGAGPGGAGGPIGPFRDVTPDARALAFEPGRPLPLRPLELRVFRAAGPPPPAVLHPPPPAAANAQTQTQPQTLARLRALAPGRIVIEAVRPEIDGGRFAIKRVVGDALEVSADIFTDGAFVLGAAILFRAEDEEAWREAPMARTDNDRWRGRIPLERNARYLYKVAAWRDVWESWRADVLKKRDAGQALAVEIAEALAFIAQATAVAPEDGRAALSAFARALEGVSGPPLVEALVADPARAVMARWGERAYRGESERALAVVVDPPYARFSAWLEIFPRSASPDPSRPGRLRDVERLLPKVREMGFDVLYFPPIHPIGRAGRKGPDNTPNAGPDDPGVPYAIGAAEGGHDAIDPGLGTLDDFDHLMRAAEAEGILIALDFAIQCSPDHPWIKAHPEWFHWRPDGTLRTAENPPKTYEDIVNVGFHRGALPGAWLAWLGVALFWRARGVRIFRVDNPHTKPFPFWEWLLGEVRRRHPDTVFLSEAFTRPKPMRRLAKLGFGQSYTYFTWRQTKAELTDYLGELAGTEVAEYLRPNFFVSTPDILPEILVHGGRPAHVTRLALAATLSPAYGVHTPFLFAEAQRGPNPDEYARSEKYQIRHWDWDAPDPLRTLVARLNRVRRDNPALWSLTNLRFLPASDEHVLFYVKATQAHDNIILVAVNLDPHAAHGATLEAPWADFGLAPEGPVEIEDLLSGHRFSWTGAQSRVELDPVVNPVALWRVAG